MASNKTPARSGGAENNRVLIRCGSPKQLPRCQLQVKRQFMADSPIALTPYVTIFTDVFTGMVVAVNLGIDPKAAIDSLRVASRDLPTRLNRDLGERRWGGRKPKVKKSVSSTKEPVLCRGHAKSFAAQIQKQLCESGEEKQGSEAAATSLARTGSAR